MAADVQQLTSTLITALSQGQAITRQLEDSTATIERLKRENEKLKQQVEDLQRDQENHRKERENAAQLATQLDQFFRRDVEKQTEIDRLRKRLAAGKERGWAPTPTTSSPLPSPVSDFSRKRPRDAVLLEEPQVLREINVNSSPGCRQLQRTKKLRARISDDRGASAIPSVAEDGAEYDVNSRPAATTTKGDLVQSTPIGEDGDTSANAPHHRLEDLLHAHPPASSTTSSTSNRRTAADPEDEEPLRSRPLHRLNLSNFKLNPKYLGDEDFAYQEVIRNKEQRKCLPNCTKECCSSKFKALASTLPMDKDMTDQELLLEHFGAGSEHKIQSMVPVAKKNLIHELRLKRVSDKYGRHKTSFEAAECAPDFWNSEMPSTQEHDKNREQAKAKERDEVKKRHEAAMNKGRWLFVDE